MSGVNTRADRFDETVLLRDRDGGLRLAQVAVVGRTEEGMVTVRDRAENVFTVPEGDLSSKK